MPPDEEPGEIRVSVYTLVEMAAQAAFQVEGIRGDFNYLLQNTKVILHGEPLPLNEKVPTKKEDVFVSISLKVDPRKNWGEVAREVQKKIIDALRSWGFPLKGVNVEVSEVDWFLE